MTYLNFSLRNDAQLKVYVPAWKHTAIKELAAQKGMTVTAMINTMLDKKLAENGVKAELRVITEQ